MPFKQLIIKQIDSVKHPFNETDFNLAYWQSKKDSTELSGGRGASQKITIKRQCYVLRHYLRGGLIARFLYDLYLWTGLKQSRPYVEKEVVQIALQNNLPVPEVVAYCVQKKGLFYRASIISRFIKNEGTLATFLYDSELADSQWFELGKLIKRFHRADIFHADLNANNILLDEAGKFTIIDFDKAKIISPLGSLAQQNVQRLLRSLEKIQNIRKQQNLPFHFNQKQWAQLLTGYK